MKVQNPMINFIFKEWLLTVSGVSLLLTSIYIKNIPSYSTGELEVLFILFILFVAVNGLRRSGIIMKVSSVIEHGKAIPLKLVVITFFLSMVFTNDIALIVIVSLTMSLKIDRKDIIVILEALAANAGSALVPFGNPQNLYIYWFYGLHPAEFMRSIAPFSIVFLFILAILAAAINTNNKPRVDTGSESVNKTAYIYGGLFFVVLMIVLHILPVLAGLLVVVFAVVFDRKMLKIDYSLLLSFFFFFGFAENLKILLETRIEHSGHIFIFSALASQIMSNVPATLLFAKFTQNWEALLWGTNVGGFGNIFGSFANLIAYRIYAIHESSKSTILFTRKFILIGYMAFSISIIFYFMIYEQ